MDKEKLKENLKESKAEIQGVQVWGRRRLAYPIKRNREGIYVYLEFSGEAKAVTHLNELMRVTDRIIRSMTVQKEITVVHTPRKFSNPGSEGQRAAAPSSESSPKAKRRPHPNKGERHGDKTA